MLENRKTLRFQCDEVLDCYRNEESFEAEIIDVSWGGIRIGCLEDLNLGEQIYIQHRDASRTQFPIRTVVRWKGVGLLNEVGLEFHEGDNKLAKDWAGELFPGESAFHHENSQRRSEVRTEVNLPILTEHGSYEGQTMDLSLSGAKFRLDEKLSDETELYLCLPWSYLELRAKVLRAQERDGQWVHSVKFQGDSREQEALAGFISQFTEKEAFAKRLML